MKPIDLCFATAAAMLCVAPFHSRAAEPVATGASAEARPVLIARADIPYHANSRAVARAPRSVGERGAMSAALKGPDSLRRYVDRTRMIYGYRYEDFARE